MCPLKPSLPTLNLALSLCLFSSLLAAQAPHGGQASRDRRHDDPQWHNVEVHLADPATASPKALEEQADLLRIRRFPEDALDFYNYALKRGGNPVALMNKLGLIELELRNVDLAIMYFRQVVKMDRRNAEGWNNLAATEYLRSAYSTAISGYKKAVKADKSIAVFHANLGTAYFEIKDYKRARRETDEALKLDPLVLQHTSGSGIAAHILSVEDRARFSFEMAKLYAQRGQIEEMLHSLAMASENGFDIVGHMKADPDLSKYRTDPRVAFLVLTAKAMHQGQQPVVTTAAARTDAVLAAH